MRPHPSVTESAQRAVDSLERAAAGYKEKAGETVTAAKTAVQQTLNEINSQDFKLPDPYGFESDFDLAAKRRQLEQKVVGAGEKAAGKYQRANQEAWETGQPDYENIMRTTPQAEQNVQDTAQRTIFATEKAAQRAAEAAQDAGNFRYASKHSSAGRTDQASPQVPLHQPLQVQLQMAHPSLQVGRVVP